MARVETQPLLGHGVAGGDCLCAALLGEFDVMPAGEEVGDVPLGLAVSEDDERAGHGESLRLPR